MKPLLILLILLTLGASLYFILKERPSSINPRQFMTNEEYEEIQKKNAKKTPEQYREEDYVRDSKEKSSEPQVPGSKKQEAESKRAETKGTGEPSEASEKNAVEQRKSDESEVTKTESQNKKEPDSAAQSSKKSNSRNGSDQAEDPNMFEAFDRVMKQIDQDRKE